MADQIRSRKTSRPAWASPFLRWALLTLVVPGLLTPLGGCTRNFFRKRADREVAGLLSDKSKGTAWELPDYFVYPDPLSRFADPTNPDRPPMPPDDPAARDFSPNPQKPGKAGVAQVGGVGYLDLLAQWDCENRAREDAEHAKDASTSVAALLDNPASADPDKEVAKGLTLARREIADPVKVDRALSEADAKQAASRERPLLINLEQCVQLGLINSREYQARREQLYLAALPVTLERFAFGSQLFAAGTAIRERSGKNSPDGQTNRWTTNSTLGFTKAFSTGALLLASFANQTVYNLGNYPSTSVSTLSLDVVQPFLRGGGRAVALEPLTQAERNLLYAIRDYVKFQQEFYVFIGAGQPTFIPGVQAGVQAISGGVVSLPTNQFVPPTLPPVTPLASNAVSVQLPIGAGGRLFALPGAGSTPQGFLASVAEKFQLINQVRNIEALTRFLRLFQVYREGDIVDEVQVGQVEQQLLRSIETLLNFQSTYRSDLDQLKQQLGLPMTLALDLVEEDLRPLYRQTRRFEDVSAAYEASVSVSQRYGKMEEANHLRARLAKLLTDGPLTRETDFSKTIGRRLGAWRARSNARPAPTALSPLEQELEKLRVERRKLLDERAALRDKGGLPKAKEDRIEAIDFEIELGQFEAFLRAYEARPWEATKDERVRFARAGALFTSVYRAFLPLLEEPFRERINRVRTLWPNLPPLCIDGVDLLADNDDKVLAAASRYALANRLDLMNNRAQLVDSWRKVAVAANALLGTFNVEYNATISTPPGGRQPFKFGGATGTSRLIFNGQLPLVRLAERNNYRATLIAYQRQRRELQLAEDNVLFQVRLDLRQLRAAGVNYHTVQKRAIELAYRQVDQALVAFSQPQTPTTPALATGLVGGPTPASRAADPAALTNQLLTTQNSLLNAQNDLYNIWVGYVTTRMSLYRDMGLMPLDARGVWIDDVATRCQSCNPPVNCAPGTEPSAAPREEKRPDDKRPAELPPALTAPTAEALGDGR